MVDREVELVGVGRLGLGKRAVDGLVGGSGRGSGWAELVAVEVDGAAVAAAQSIATAHGERRGREKRDSPDSLVSAPKTPDPHCRCSLAQIPAYYKNALPSPR